MKGNTYFFLEKFGNLAKSYYICNKKEHSSNGLTCKTMDNIEQIINAITLTAKTGTYFAKCDGEYDEREEKFIATFLKAIKQISDIRSDTYGTIKASLDETITLNNLINETKQLMSHFNAQEQRVLKETIEQFIREIIAADHKLSNEEHTNYAAWQKALNDVSIVG